MFYCFFLINDHTQRSDTDFDMLFNVVLGNDVIAFVGFYTFRYHRLVGYQQQGSCRNMIGKTATE